MDFRKYFLKLTLEAINGQISNGYTIINAKRIRQYHNIPNSDKSKINFIWKGLKCLEKAGIIALYKNRKPSKPKQYYLPKEMLNIEKIIGN